MSLESLKSKIEQHNILYRQGNPEISDIQYDDLLEELEFKMDKSEFQTFKESLLDIPGKTKHNYIIGSLNKAKSGTDQLQKWFCKYNITDFVAMEKVDGMSIVLRYENGLFKQATTRGNGILGENQTNKFKHIVRQKLKYTFTGEIRAEVTLTKKSFELLKEMEPDKDHKNLRNSTAGIINSKDVEVEKLKLLSVICYQILGANENIPFQLLVLKDYGLTTVKYITLHDYNQITPKLLSQWKYQADYDIDGLVICDHKYSGENAYHPEKMIAFKVDDESEVTTVIDIERSVSKQGYIKAVAILKPVQLNGTTVKRATLYNEKWAIDRKIGIGAEVEIIKSGEIIPKIVNVVTESMEDYITNCPCCNSELILNGVELQCINPDCEDKNIKLVESFLIKMGVEGISETSLRNWNITSFDKLFAWKPVSGKMQNNFYQELLTKVYQASPETIISCMYYPGAGRKTINKLLKEYDLYTLSEIIYNSGSDYSDNLPEGIGKITMDNISETWNNNFELLETIINDSRYCYTPIQEQTEAKSSILLGKSFCFTGKISQPRKVYEQMVKDNGGTIKGVSKKLNYLVVGAKAGNKLAKAEKLGVTILTEEEFLTLIENN